MELIELQIVRGYYLARVFVEFTWDYCVSLYKVSSLHKSSKYYFTYLIFYSLYRWLVKCLKR